MVLGVTLAAFIVRGLGMSVIVVSYFFSDLCGSKMAEVSALGATLTPPLLKAGYRREDAASLIASGTAMGMLVHASATGYLHDHSWRGHEHFGACPDHSISGIAKRSHRGHWLPTAEHRHLVTVSVDT
jgi:hypothetical protein